MRSIVDDVMRSPFASLDDSRQHLPQGSTIVNLHTLSLFSFLSAGFVPCLNARYASALAIILFLATGSAVSHQALATSEVGLQGLLLEIERRGIEADFEIEKVPNRSVDEVDRIMGVLDKIMAREVPRIFEEHYRDVEKSIQNVFLPENISTDKIWWESTSPHFSPGCERGREDGCICKANASQGAQAYSQYVRAPWPRSTQQMQSYSRPQP